MVSSEWLRDIEIDKKASCPGVKTKSHNPFENPYWLIPLSLINGTKLGGCGEVQVVF